MAGRAPQPQGGGGAGEPQGQAGGGQGAVQLGIVHLPQLHIGEGGRVYGYTGSEVGRRGGLTAGYVYMAWLVGAMRCWGYKGYKRTIITMRTINHRDQD